MGIEIKREPLRDNIGIVIDLVKKHYEEVTLHKEIKKLDPDWDRYLKLEALSQFVFLTARDDGEMVGYCSMFVMPHIHYKDTLCATNDAIYLLPEYRKTDVGPKLIGYAEKIAKVMGCQHIVWHIKYGYDFSPLMYRNGYEDEEKCVGKVL